MFDYVFYWSLVWSRFPSLIDGAVVTLQVTVLSMMFGTLIAMPMALVDRSRLTPLSSFVSSWIEIARNTPALFQVYMFYFGLGAFAIHLDSYVALVLAITFNNVGYLAEIFRGGLRAVPTQQRDAARSLGMSAVQAHVHVVFPQLFQVTYKPFTNQLTWAMLNTSLGMVIGLRELTGAAWQAQSVSFRTFEFFIVTAAIYYVIFKVIELGTRLLARVLFRT